jgi:allantoin racemase
LLPASSLPSSPRKDHASIHPAPHYAARCFAGRAKLKLLLVNPNTSAAITRQMADVAMESAGPGVEFMLATSDFGARVIASRADAAIAEQAVIDLIERHAHGCDAIVLGVSLDCALAAARQRSGVPVTALTEAALLRAQALGKRAGFVTLGPAMLPIYQELAASYRMSAQIAAWRALDVPIAVQDGIDPHLAEALRDAALATLAEGAECVILTGAVLAGYAKEIQQQVPVPVLDGVRCATEQAIAEAGGHQRKE